MTPKRGRPRTLADPARIAIRLPADRLAAIDARATELGIGRSEMLRVMVREYFQTKPEYAK